MSRILRLIASCGLSAGFLYLACRHMDGAEVLRAVRNVHPRDVLLAAVAQGLVQVARAARWGILVRPFSPLPLPLLWRISNVGNLAVMLLPLRLGELARPYLMRRDAQASFTQVMGAVAVERVLDGLLITLAFFATTASLRPPFAVPGALRAAAVAALGVFAGASIGIVLAVTAGARMRALAMWLVAPRAPQLAARLVAFMDAFLAGLRALPRGGAMVALLLWTFAYWAANALSLDCLLRGFGWALPPVAACTLVCVLVIGVMIPAGPGMLGTFQVAVVAGLAVFNIEESDALAYSMVAYAVTLAIVLLFGLPYMFGRGRLHFAAMAAPQAAAPPSR